MATMALPTLAIAASSVCEVKSGETITPVIELYTSEGCSSCPPADKWLSTLKGKPVVAQAFHVGYWDYIGWVDRFASPIHTTRQREIASANKLRTIYTPQLIHNGRDWREGYGRDVIERNTPAETNITMKRTSSANSFEARISPSNASTNWNAYWTVTEHNHNSKVKAGENAGKFLQHDFVVRQYVPVGRYQGAQTLQFVATPSQAGHPRQINLVVVDPQNSEPLQAVSLQCNS